MRQLATIQRIADIQPIDGADSIEKVRVNDWWCVAKKGEFKAGDLCVYFEIDSLLPSSNPAFEFLKKGTKEKTMVVEGITYTGYRLKTIRLRGQVSQGLALPIDTVMERFDRTSKFPSAFDEHNYIILGADISHELNVVKYEAPIPANLAGKVKGNFPSFIPKTDEERVQNIGDLIEAKRGTVVFITEKIDGTSATYYKKDGVFGVCSRNLDLLETEGNTHWMIARRLDIENKIPDNFAIQGEIFGSSIGTNPFGLTEQSFACFNAYNIAEGKYLDFADWMDFCITSGIPPVPVLSTGHTLIESAGELIAKYDGLISTLDDKTLAEGVVIRPRTEERVVMRGSETRFSFKVISNAYLLKGGE